MKLNKEQYVAAHHMDGPMLVLAGPGSGKTHLLVERIRIMIEENHIPPESILVITFSKKAALQMQARFNKRVEGNTYPVTFGTFHAVFYHILKEEDPHTLRLITEDEQKKILKEAVSSCRATSELFTNEENAGDAIGMIGASKNFGKSFFDRCEYGRAMDETERQQFQKIVHAYDMLCRRAGLIDFDDMLIRCGKMLYEHEMILRKWQRRYRYFLVDEFQDINDAQYSVLRLLAGDARNVFAVGDDDQSIYAFRGARPQLMKKFLKQYIGCRQVTLTMNYRCCENVIGASDTLIRHNTDRLERPIQRHLPSKSGGTVEVINSESTDVQAAYVCERICGLMADHGYAAKDFAVLFRSHHCAVMFEKTAEERGLALKHADGEEAVPKARLIHEAYVRAHAGTASRADYFLIMNNPPRGLSREALCPDTGNYMEDLKAYYEDDVKMLESVYDLEDTIKSRPESYRDDNGPGNDLMHGPDNNYGDARTEHVNKDDRINVMTAHASKGLEFAVVFVIGLQEGLFPHHRNMTDEGAKEERRLMYVAMTRAKERLYMCTVSTEHGKRPSRFAAESMEKKKYINDVIRLTRTWE